MYLIPEVFVKELLKDYLSRSWPYAMAIGIGVGLLGGAYILGKQDGKKEAVEQAVETIDSVLLCDEGRLKQIQIKEDKRVIFCDGGMMRIIGQ